MPNTLNILVIGSGGREHALCWKIAQSPLLAQLYCAPGNPGIAELAECVNPVGNAEIVDFCLINAIDLVVIGPEQPLVDGLSDALRAAKINVFGCSKAAAQLEGSKGFTKDLCEKYNIPTAAYARFDNLSDAKTYLARKGAPIVVKADGLAAGKGVTVARTASEAERALETIFGGQFGPAGNEVVMEDMMVGEELSFFALCDGKHVRAFAGAQDHKAVGEGDTGPNTGGMGTYSPAPVLDDAMRKRVTDEIIHPTMKAMEAEGIPFQGILFAGLMLTDTGPQLIEYNVRFGDPETQVMLPRLKSDLVPLLMACATGKGLMEAPLELRPDSTLCVVMATQGYPGSYAKGSEIKGLDALKSEENLIVFHAGTQQEGNKITANGGRVLGVTAMASTIEAAQKKAYAAVDQIDWPQGFCRRDIGWRAIKT